MRAEGSTVSDPRDWSPSPAWPEGRGVFVLRPLLSVGRGEIRDWLAARGETWLDDPANDDPRSARARARRDLRQANGMMEQRAASLAPSVAPPSPFDGGGEGYLTLPRDAPAAHVAAACLCAAGTVQPPRGQRLQRLVDRIRAGEAFTATLAGARIEAAGDAVSFFREPGEARRFGPPAMGEVAEPVALSPRQPVVWDGRYELTAVETGLIVRPLQGLAARLPAAQRQALKGLPAAARPGLPAVLAPDGTVTCPILAGDDATRARCLVVDRFDAATGRVDQEPAT
jgi:tRNA(Ile)-lysidine synthase